MVVASSGGTSAPPGRGERRTAGLRSGFWVARAGLFAYTARSSRGACLGAFPFAFKVVAMSRRCELTGVGPMVGHNVSHSNIKTKRRFLPALMAAKLHSESLGQNFTLR